jgi:hypothetical protein
MRTLALVVMAAMLAAPMGAMAEEHKQVGLYREGVCDGQFHKEEVYENHEARPVRVARSRLFMSTLDGGAYTSRDDGLIMAMTHFGTPSPTNQRDTDVAPPGLTLLIQPEGYIYVTYWCFTGSFFLWVFVDYGST